MFTFKNLVVSLAILSCAQGQNAGPGDSCGADDECKGFPEAASCVVDGGYCWCNEGFNPLIPPDGELGCFKVLNELGEECIFSGQCQVGVPGPYSDCLPSEATPETTVCTCTEEAISYPGSHECVLKATEVGGVCEEDAECEFNLGEHAFCDISVDPKVCACDLAESLVSDDNKKCLPFMDHIGDPCEQKEQCQYGDPALSDCIDSYCSCAPEAISKPEEDKCLKKATLIGDLCEDVAQCSANLGDLSECQNTKCQCLAPPDAIPSKDNDFCLPIRQEIGDECEEDSQCKLGSPGEFSECLLENGAVPGTCNCDADGIQDPDNTADHHCYEKAEKIGDVCAFDAQCESKLGDGSTCESGTCSCKDGFVPGDGDLLCVKGGYLIGAPCEEDRECVGVPGVTSECSTSEHICVCKDNYVASGDRETCLAYVDTIGGECVERQQCQLGKPGLLSNCLPNSASPPTKVCICEEKAIDGGDNKCYLKATSVGDACEVNRQCLYLGQSSCIGLSCVCIGNSVPSSDRSECVLRKFLGEECVDEQQCVEHISNSNCVIDAEDQKQKCDCDNGYKNPDGVNDKCYQLAESVGGSCAEHEVQCDQLVDVHCNSAVPPSTCDCVDETDVVSESGMKCLNAVPELHEQCDESVQCKRNGSECRPEPETSQKECQCKTGEFIEADEAGENAGTCLEIHENINRPCKENVQCSLGMGPNAECLAGLCQCKSSFAFYEGTCLRAVPLGETCALNEECQAGVEENNELAECRGLKCQCKTSTIEFEESCWLDKRVGHSCNVTKECTVSIFGPVKCDTTTNICVCEADAVQDAEGRICSGVNISVKWQFNMLLMLVVIVGLSNY